MWLWGSRAYGNPGEFSDIDLIVVSNKLAEKFPMLEKVNLHKQKVDLDRLPEKYKFKNIEDLKEHYFERFSNKK